MHEKLKIGFMNASPNVPSGVDNLCFVTDDEILYEGLPESPEPVDDSSLTQNFQDIQNQLNELQSIQRSFRDQVKQVMGALPPEIVRQGLPDTESAKDFMAAMNGLLGDEAGEIVSEKPVASSAKRPRKFRPRV